MMIPNRSTRRAFLRSLGTLGAAAWAGRTLAESRPIGFVPETTSRPSTPGIAPDHKSIVAHLISREVIPSTTLYEDLLRELIEEALRVALSVPNVEQVWSRVVPSEGVIAVKLDPLGARGLNTRLPMARQIVHSLITTGRIEPERIMLVDVPGRERDAVEQGLQDRLERPVRLKPQVYGFGDEEVELSGGRTRLARWVTQSAVVVNVPSLKTHNIGGLSGSLMNLAYAVVQGPGRFYGSDCAPFVGEILAQEAIRARPMVHILNAIRAVFDGGPDARPETTWEHCGLMAGIDPVAVDAMGLDLVNDRRADAGLPLIGGDLASLPYLRDAAARGLGTDDQDYIDLRQASLT